MHLVYQVPGAQELCPDGPVPLEGRVRLPSVARTLRAIVDDGRQGFYGGEFGRELVRLGDGVYVEDDLTHDFAQWCEPSRLRVWGHDLWTVPAPSQGYLTLASSWIAERAGLGTDPSDPLWAHLIVEASRAAGHDRPAVLYDGADASFLLDEERLAAAADRIRDDRAWPSDVGVGAPDDPSADIPRVADGDTTHLCAVDADGLGISLTQSNALDFGSHLVAGSTGIFLHNRGVGFSLVPGHPAELAPRTRPPHTLSPMLATRADGELSHVVGAMGGDAQPQILQQVLARMLHAGEDPGHGGRGGPCLAGGARGRAVPPVVGRRPPDLRRGARSIGMGGGVAGPWTPGDPGHGLRAQRRRRVPDHCGRPQRRRHTAFRGCGRSTQSVRGDGEPIRTGRSASERAGGRG